MSYLNIGESRKIGDLRIGVLNERTIYVTGWSRAVRIEDLTKKRVLDELNAIKMEFRFSIDDAPNELKDFIRDKIIKYNIAYNYGMGSVEICHELNEIIYWNLDIKN